MTVILAGKDNKGCPYIGSDSQGSEITKGFKNEFGKKLIKIHNFIVGYTYSYRTAQLIEYNANKFKKINTKQDVFNFLKILKKLMVDDGQKKESESGRDVENTVGLIIITKKNIYVVEGNYSFFEVEVASIGCGKELCLGAFTALDEEKDIVKKIEKSIEIAKKYDAFVGGKIYIETI